MSVMNSRAYVRLAGSVNLVKAFSTTAFGAFLIACKSHVLAKPTGS